MTRGLRVYFVDETTRDFPADTYCTASDVGVLFHGQDGHLEAWYRLDLVHHVERTPEPHGVQIVPPWGEADGSL